MFLDLSKAACGWAVDNPQGDFPPLIGTWSPYDQNMKRGAVGHGYQKWLHRSLREHRVEMVCYEQPITAGPKIFHDYNTKVLLFGLALATETIAASLKLESDGGAANSIRKSFLGLGNPTDPKETVFLKCEDLGWPVKNYDESDAVAGWVWAKLKHDKKFVWHNAMPLFAASQNN